MSFRRKDTPSAAAAKASFSTATAYRIESDPQPPSQKQPPRSSRRSDPLDGIFEKEVVPLLVECPSLRAVTIFEELRRRHRKLPASVRRTIERRVRRWRALHGPEQEVILAQKNPPGRLGLSDFTATGDLGVTIGGVPLTHLLYHFRLPYSGFEYADVVLGGDSFVALSGGCQNALWLLGAVPEEHRTDSLPAAYHNLDQAASDDLTRRYQELCDHYGMRPTRNNRGQAHENGSVESSHGHLKRAIEQALPLRGSRDFDDLAAYRACIAEIVSRHNARHRARIDAERAVLRPLPVQRTADFELERVQVSVHSGFTLRKVFYSVPSRLIGQTLRVHRNAGRGRGTRISACGRATRRWTQRAIARDAVGGGRRRAAGAGRYPPAARRRGRRRGGATRCGRRSVPCRRGRRAPRRAAVPSFPQFRLGL